ncbi:hypothetical protein BC939DRAFT_183563 [Gamsiella multidivaricata]|uniref:uncharacterized protein n=1 Tax=Gamsiella multidivaricata TaxID=101098 RepID=UPI00221F0F0B|nr:uncharacterized protein BC939DRAFT_183563 [Gamsiella multidivaricata]KAI7822411.1 hypothetical protein BC939DRAFT_183563 [Gamsiella multidivaricata]
MSIRLVSSAKSLREQFKGPASSGSTSNNIMTSSGISVYTASSSISRAKTLEPSAITSLSRQGSLLRSTSNGNLRRSKSTQKKGLISKVFADEAADPHDALPDLSMEMTLLIVKRCVKEIRERGLTTKGILRQVQMAQSQRVIIDTIRMILDDDASTELSPLHQIDIHLVAHAMKWAIRYSEEILVAYEDYQALYIEQDRNFTRFARDLPPTNRAILLDLFSLCADVTLLAHLNNMTLVAVAKAISLSIMAGPEREFSTFDASLQQRNLWGAACEDLLRAFLRIKTTHDLAKIDQEEEVDENRYICNETRVLKSARQRTNESGRSPHNINLPSGLDISVPSSAGSSLPGSAGWGTSPGPMSAASHYPGANGYFDLPRSGSPLSQADGTYGSSLSRSQSLAKSGTLVSGRTSPSPYNADDISEYEELMQDRSHLQKLRQDRNNFLRPAESLRRRSSVADMESLYMLPLDAAAPPDGYESDPEVSHPHEDEDSHDLLIPDFADGLGWDFSKNVAMNSTEMPSLASFQAELETDDKHGMNRSNSASSDASGLEPNGPAPSDSPRNIRELSKQQLTSLRLRQLQEKHQAKSSSSLSAPWQQDLSARNFPPPPISPPPSAITRTITPLRVRASPAIYHHPPRTSPSFRPHHSKRNSASRRSISINPATLNGRAHMWSDSLQADLLAQELALQAERDLVIEGIHMQLLEVRNADHQEPSRASSVFSLQLSPQDLERPAPVSFPKADRPRTMYNIVEFPSLSDKLSVPELKPSLQRRQSIASINEPEVSASNAPKAFEVVSRPKDVEVSVIFAPIPKEAPLSPKPGLKSKFHENFPERPISPPIGYTHTHNQGGPKRSLTGISTRSGDSITSPTSPTSASRPSRPHTAPTQQNVTFSATSTTSSQPSTGDGRPKTGFIRALSFKLRSKQSDDQLKPVRINNQAVGTITTAPAVSFEPPRLELSFMGDSLTSTELGPDDVPEEHLPPTSAPALMHQGANGADVLESWRRQALASLPININNGTAGLAQQDLRPNGLTLMRRASEAMIKSSDSLNRSQFQQLKKEASPPIGPLQTTAASKKNDASGSTTEEPIGRSTSRQQKQQEALPRIVSVVNNAVSTQETPLSPSSESSIPKKTAAAEKEYHFSTATLLKDGKLYYQVQWDQFSELGFKSDFFAEPEQFKSGIHSIGKSPVDPRKQSSIAAAATGPEVTRPQGEQTTKVNSRNASVDLRGQLGQATRNTTTQEQGPSPAQRAAAMQVARESFMALANDPKAMEALKSRPGQPTVISSGSFAKGSTHPQLDSHICPPVITSKLNMTSRQQQQPYPSPDPSPSGSLKSARSIELLSGDGEGRDSAQKNMYNRSSPVSSPGGEAPLSGFSIAKQPGSVAVGGGGHGLFSSSSPAPRLDKPVVSGSSTFEIKSGSRLFGKKNKSMKKSAQTLPSNTNGGRKRRLLPYGVKRQDVMTRTVESMDEIFPWMCIEHMAGQDSGWVMLEPVQDGAVGWVIIDKLEEEESQIGLQQQKQQQPEQQRPFEPKTAMQAQVA